MRYKAVFIAGIAVGFMAGSRAGRGAYDRIISSGRKIAAHPKVQQATTTVQAKAADLGKTAAAKAPDYAKNAATNVPKIVSNAKQAATEKIPARFGGSAGGAYATDDVAPDGNLVYPADGGASSVNGARYTPDTP
jgi:hypothetical protein